MRYIHIHWRHDSSDDPVDLFSEIDDQSWEVRKVEVFRDGKMGFADEGEATDSTALGLEPVPALEEVARDPQFEPKEISRAEFERVWRSARQATHVG